ncbi:MAG: Nif3-like dinuclear metal center hexameric protein [Sideroxydans sp.]|nr:Nif3-like dinuclear metal center hexameric protein [Sideroxydans sp.]
MQLFELSDYIGRELAVSRFRDYCPNGVQIEGRSEITRIATAVTASKAVLEAATEWGADAILVHHGYFWRNEDPCVTGLKKKRIAHLLKHDMSLLAYHLPLDAHPDMGNNAQLGRRLDFVEEGRFGEQDIAFYGRLRTPQTLAELKVNIEKTLQRESQVIGDLNRHIERVAWCSGGGQSYFEQAIALGVHVFMTGEASEQCFHLANEAGVGFIAAGHHATERYGIQSVGENVAAQFGVEHRFFDELNPI